MVVWQRVGCGLHFEGWDFVRLFWLFGYLYMGVLTFLLSVLGSFGAGW